MFLKISQYSQENNRVKKRLQHSCFPANIAKFLRTALYRIPPVAASDNQARGVRFNKKWALSTQFSLIASKSTLHKHITQIRLSAFLKCSHFHKHPCSEETFDKPVQNFNATVNVTENSYLLYRGLQLLIKVLEIELWVLWIKFITIFIKNVMWVSISFFDGIWLFFSHVDNNFV